jgi:DNA-binding MarR family transcriptional regulator
MRRSPSTSKFPRRTKREPPEAEGFVPHIPGIDYDILDELMGYALRRAQIVLYEDFDRSLLGTGLTPQRFAALVIIGANPGLSQTRLGHILGIARSGAMVLTDWLEQERLAERRSRDGDRRTHGLHLTATGEASLKTWKSTVRAHDRRMASRLTDSERRELNRLLAKLAGDERP